jgi:dihydrofolate reductase
MKSASDVPLRTMGSLSLARQLMAAGLVDRLRLMIFPLTSRGPEPDG